jgi:hypothetical protein
LPDGLLRKYSNAAREWSWQYVFPSSRLSIDPRSGKRQRHHIAEGVLQAAVKNAVGATGLTKQRPVTHLNKPGFGVKSPLD